MTPSASIIIASRNRAASLRATLASIAATTLPEPTRTELILVDNGSTDDTLATMSAFEAPSLAVQVLREPRPGKVRALTRGLEAATGDMLLFTDDDVRVPPDWVAGMCAPLLAGTADAVAGAVRLAPPLRRPWLNALQSALLAETTGVFGPDGPSRLVGANMALHRRVFEVLSFDPQLGPGARGLEEDTLLGLQLKAHGYRVAGAPDTVVVHVPGTDRLRRGAFLSALDKLGRSQAYVNYHWRHERASVARSALAAAYWGLYLAGWRVTQRLPSTSDEGISPDEMHPAFAQAYHREMLTLAGTPRRYARPASSDRERAGAAARPEAARAEVPTGRPA
jgi:glycosyltransferase involved in cell wall biosynthesis